MKITLNVVMFRRLLLCSLLARKITKIQTTRRHQRPPHLSLTNYKNRRKQNKAIHLVQRKIHLVNPTFVFQMPTRL